MAMVGQARQFDELAMLGCDMNSDVAFFFSKVPERMKKPPPNADAIFAAIAEEVEDTHTATLHMLYTHVYTHEDCVYTL